MPGPRRKLLSPHGVPVTGHAHRHRLLTFATRLVRDLAERRKPPLVLLRRGWALQRAEPALIRTLVRRGAIPVRASEVEAALR